MVSGPFGQNSQPNTGATSSGAAPQQPVITEDVWGLSSALPYLSRDLRLNERLGIVEILLHGRWVDFDDYRESHLKEQIRNTQLFNRQRGQNFVTVPADFSEKHWRDAKQAYLDLNRYDMVDEYFKNLPPWDNTPRLDTMLITGLKAIDTPLNRAVAKCHMIATVARTYSPGVKHDIMPILVGEQGGGKSSFILGLCPIEDLVVEGLSLDSQYQKIQETLAGKIFIEFSELRGLNGRTINDFKGLLSQHSDTFRPAYGRATKRFPRTWVA